MRRPAHPIQVLVALAAILALTSCSDTDRVEVGDVAAVGDGAPAPTEAPTTTALGPIDLDVVRAAAASTLAAGSGRYSYSLGEPGAAPLVSMTAEFDGDLTHQLASSSVSAVGGDQVLETVTGPDGLTARGSVVAALGSTYGAFLGDGLTDLSADRWYSIDTAGLENLSSLLSVGSLDAELGGAPVSQEFVGIAAGATGDVTIVGNEEVRGVATTRVAVVLDLTKVLRSPWDDPVASRFGRSPDDTLLIYAEETAFPVELWLDGRGHIRRLSYALPDDWEDLNGVEAQVAGDHITNVVELWDLDADVDVMVPEDAVPLDIPFAPAG